MRIHANAVALRRGILLGVICLSLGACSSQTQLKEEKVMWEQLEWKTEENLSYADQFQVDSCEKYEMITIVDSGRFLLVSEEEEIPVNLPEDVVVLHKPLDRVYVAGSAAFDPIRVIGALNAVRFSGTRKDRLYIEEAARAIEEGDMQYAGKYNAPDYELLLSEGCDMALESTMIYHDPETKEKLESLGIPVFVERSSYESHPLGRLEWVKLYGVLFERKEEANRFFEEQLELLKDVWEQEQTQKKVAFFHVNSNGVVTVRKPGDYIARMITLAGGEYFLTAMPQEENALSSMNMQMEDFYLAARDADILIYNSAIVGELSQVSDLIQINPLFAQFKAVEEGNVYCTSKDLYQETTGIGIFMKELSRLIHDEKEDFHYLKRL